MCLVATGCGLGQQQIVGGVGLLHLSWDSACDFDQIIVTVSLYGGHGYHHGLEVLPAQGTWSGPLGFGEADSQYGLPT